MLYVSAVIYVICSYAIFKYGVRKLGTTLAATWVFSVVSSAITIEAVSGVSILTNSWFIVITVSVALFILLLTTPAMYFVAFSVVCLTLGWPAVQIFDPGAAVGGIVFIASIVLVVLLRDHIKILTVGSFSGLDLSAGIICLILGVVGPEVISMQAYVLGFSAMSVAFMIGGIFLQYKVAPYSESAPVATES